MFYLHHFFILLFQYTHFFIFLMNISAKKQHQGVINNSNKRMHRASKAPIVPELLHIA